MTRRLRVAVLAGGRSSEHDISLASARSVIEALDPSRYDVASIAIARDGHWQLEPAEPTAGARPGPDPGRGMSRNPSGPSRGNAIPDANS